MIYVPKKEYDATLKKITNDVAQLEREYEAKRNDIYRELKGFVFTYAVDPDKE